MKNVTSGSRLQQNRVGVFGVNKVIDELAKGWGKRNSKIFTIRVNAFLGKGQIQKLYDDRNEIKQMLESLSVEGRSSAL